MDKLPPEIIMEIAKHVHEPELEILWILTKIIHKYDIIEQPALKKAHFSQYLPDIDVNIYSWDELIEKRSENTEITVYGINHNWIRGPDPSIYLRYVTWGR